METCGYICVGSSSDNFLLRCSYCPTDIKIAQWQEFVLHFRNLHSLIEEEDNKWPPEDRLEVSLSPENIEEIAVAAVKDELLDDGSAENDDPELSPWDPDAEVKLELEAEASLSGSASLDIEDSCSDNAETDSESNEESEQEEDENAATYKYNPSFFRRNPRTSQFIESYKSQPCLWNPTHAKYRDSFACKVAYQQLIRELNLKIGVTFNEPSLKAAIKKLHIQYNMIQKRVQSGTQSRKSVAFAHYTSCDFLKSCDIQYVVDRNDKIRLDFSKKNQFTSDFIKLYENFPQLYDPKHSEFSNVNSRQQAYETFAAEISMPNADISNDDIYLAIQKLRQWYYKSAKHALSDSEQFYLSCCRFLPAKMFKQKLSCEICHKIVFSDKVLQSHLSREHNIGELPFKCTLCERRFISRAELSTHMARFHIGKTHKCGYCERSFAVPMDLTLHVRTHTGHKPFICELCGKAFRLRSQLTHHDTAIHTKIRAFKCTMCPKDFLKKVHLTDHIKSHLNIRDKICAICGKGFTSCHSLIRHRQIHAEVKKFECKLCDSRFSQFVGLNSHMKRTHNIVRNNAQKATETVGAEDSNNS